MNNNQETTSVEYMGYWWLPQKPEQTLMGIMLSSEEGIYLELHGSFETLENLDIDNDVHSIILGFSKDGKLLTCHNAIGVNQNIRFLGITTIEYSIELVFIGVHFNKSEDMKFHEVFVEYTYLSDWVYTYQPKFLEKWNEEWNNSGDIPNLTNFLNNLPKLSAKTSNATISVEVNMNRNVSLLEKKINRSAQISIKLINQELTIDDFYKTYVYPLQNLLTLATNQNNFVTKISVISCQGAYSTNSSANMENVIDILSSNIRKDRYKISNNKLFTLKDIENEFSLYVQKWLNINEEIKHICNNYFGVQYARQSMYADSIFINLVQTLESYHRIKVDKNQNYEQDHKNKIESIYKKCPPEYLDWLREKLTFSYEPSLKTRIEELTKIYEKVLEPFVTNQNAFIKKIKDTRNYYTHYNQSLKTKAATGEELFRINQILSYMIQSCLFNELGCTPERCADLMKLNKKYNYTIRSIQKANFKW